MSPKKKKSAIERLALGDEWQAHEINFKVLPEIPELLRWQGFSEDDNLGVVVFVEYPVTLGDRRLNGYVFVARELFDKASADVARELILGDALAQERQMRGEEPDSVCHRQGPPPYPPVEVRSSR